MNTIIAYGFGNSTALWEYDRYKRITHFEYMGKKKFFGKTIFPQNLIVAKWIIKLK